MDAIVQLIRNALCCVKDLGLFPDTFLWDTNYTLQYYNLPEPLNQTTPLEVLISLSQFYAFVFTTAAGWNLCLQSLGKLWRIQRIMAVRGPVQTDADRLVNASLVKEGLFAVRFCWVGVYVACIGVSFFWLFCNSWHITETNWVGGLPGLIHALTVMEVCLLPLLYYMYKDGWERLAKASRMETLAKRMLQNKRLSAPDVSLSLLEEVAGWVPFWDAGVGVLAAVDSSSEEKEVAAEVARVQDHLEQLVGGDDRDKDGGRQEHIAEKANELLAKVRIYRLEGYREFLYLLLNSIAFYGYMVGILVFYWQKEDEQPLWLRRGLLYMNNSDADWHGNFAGDLMWTIEPMVILTSPKLINALRPFPRKEKVD